MHLFYIRIFWNILAFSRNMMNMLTFADTRRKFVDNVAFVHNDNGIGSWGELYDSLTAIKQTALIVCCPYQTSHKW